MNIIGYTKAKIDSLIATKADLVNGDVPDAQLPDRLQDVALRAAYVPATAIQARRWALSSDGTTRQGVEMTPGDFGAITNPGYQPIVVDPGVKHQDILGFGAAITDATSYLLQTKLNQVQRTALLTELFAPDQGNLSIVRICIGNTDAVGAVTGANASFDDQPIGTTDPSLAGFSIAADQQYKVTTLREIMAINPRVRIIASPWSPPGWMKTDPTKGLVGSSVSTANFPALAQYFVKFIQAYETLGVPVYAVCPQNEPLQVNPWPSNVMTAADQATFIGTHLGPAFDAAGLSTRIWCYDDGWATSTTYVDTVFANATAAPYVDAAAWHWYSGDPTIMRTYARKYPTKGHIVTEATGVGGHPLTVGTAHDRLFIGSLRNHAKAVLLWHIALDENGGVPGMSVNTEVGVYTVPEAGGSYSRTINYWTLTQTSRFVKPGAVRISSSHYAASVQSTAYLNPDGSIVLVAYNASASTVTTQVIDARTRQAVPLTLPAGEAVTLTWTGKPAGPAALTIAPPAAPTLTASAGKGTITLTIAQGSPGGAPASGIEITRGASASQRTLLATLAPGTTSWTVTAPAGTAQFYGARVTNAGGWSPSSAEVTATAGALTVPGAPGLTVTAGNQSAALVITPPADSGGAPITGYRIYRGTSAGVDTTGTALATVTSTAYTDTPLTNGTVYYYRVVAVNSVGGSTASTERTATPAFVETRTATKPTTTTQPALWLRADQIAGLANGAAVTAWSDSSGNGRTATPPAGTSSAGTYTTSAVNSLPAVQLRSATAQKLFAPYPIVAENVTIFLVMKAPTAATVGVLTGTAADATTAANYTPNVYRDTAGIVHAQVVNVGSSNAPSTAIGTAWSVVAFSYDTATGHAQKMVANGGTIGQYAPGAYTVGTPAAGLGFAADIDLAEVIVIPAVLSDTDRHSWTVYLGQVYGITVGAN